MHLTEAVLAPLRQRYGEPRSLQWESEVSAEEFALAGSSPERRHDVTFFVFDPRGRLALIQKPSYPEGVWRPPGGGVGRESASRPASSGKRRRSSGSRSSSSGSWSARRRSSAAPAA
jgi:hypothetical protein